MSIENLDHVALGILYDFMGWLTTREKRLILSSSDNAAPAAEAVEEFRKLRGIEDCEPLTQWEGRLSKALQTPINVLDKGEQHGQTNTTNGPR